MAIKRCLFVCFFVVLTLGLPGILYLADGGYTSPIGNIIEGNGSREDSSEVSDEEEQVNFSSYTEGPDKDEIIAVKIDEWLELKKDRAEAEAKAQAEAAKAAESRTAGSSTSVSQKEQQMLSYVNEVRIQAGLPTLTYCSQLTSAARAKSMDMIVNNYFSHTSPRYGGLGGLLSHYGISYRMAGENLAMNSSGSVSAAHNSLMASPGHRANILGNSFSHVGIGIQVKGDGSHYYTQLFVGY